MLQKFVDDVGIFNGAVRRLDDDLPGGVPHCHRTSHISLSGGGPLYSEHTLQTLECFVVFFTVKDCLPTSPSIHYVVVSVFKFNSNWSAHLGRLAGLKDIINRFDPYLLPATGLPRYQLITKG